MPIGIDHVQHIAWLHPEYGKQLLGRINAARDILLNAID